MPRYNVEVEASVCDWIEVEAATHDEAARLACAEFRKDNPALADAELWTETEQLSD